MPYLSRLIEHSGIVIGRPQSPPRQNSAPDDSGLMEIQAFREPEPAIPSGEPQSPGTSPLADPVSILSPTATLPEGPFVAADRPDRSSASGAERGIPPTPGASLPRQSGAAERPIGAALDFEDRPRLQQDATAAPRQSTIVEVVSLSDQQMPVKTRTVKAPPTLSAGPIGTVAEVRAWVAATPAQGEMIVAPPTATPLETEITVPDPVFARRLPDAAAFEQAQLTAEHESVQNVHLTIGSIVVTIEGPEQSPAAADPPPAGSVPSSCSDEPVSRRLLRHYLRA